jgi:cold shock CspA family protein
MTAMKRGVVTRVHAGRFGFIRPADNSPALFFHSKQTEGSEPQQGELVTYILGKDRTGRPRASRVRVVAS